MKKLSLRKTALALLTSTAVAMISVTLVPSAALAQTLYWDGSGATADGNVDGGAGTWNDILENWTDVSGFADFDWVPGADAVFTTSPGIIEIDGDKTIGDLTFDVSGYVLQDASGSPGDIVVDAGPHTITTVAGLTTINADITGAGSIQTSGNGFLYLYGNNSFAGGLNISPSVLVSLNNNNAAGTGAISSATSGNLFFGTGVDIANNIDIGSFISFVQNGGSATASGNISGLNFGKTGTGELIISGTNTYTGTTTITNGMLTTQGGSAIGDNSAVTISSVFTGTLNIENSEAIGSLAGSGAVIIDGSQTLSTGYNNLNTQFSGLISGGGNLAKYGTGSMILSGANTYTGTTTINAGTLSLDGGAAIADTGSVTTAAAGTLNIIASETINAMNNAGAINLANGAIGNNLTLAGDYSGTGVINVDVDFSTDMADKLIIGGNVTGGTTNIVVSDITTGAATGNDVLIVDVTGTSGASDFTLSSGPITSGAFTYDLTQIGADWFLSQTLSPLTATYEIYPQTLLALNKFSTFRSRTNSRFYASGEEQLGDVWGVIEASFAKINPESSTTASTYETSVWKMKSGVDGILSANEDGRFVVGFNGYYGTTSTNITSTNGNGSIFTQGFGVGLSGTYFGNQGFYVDGQLQLGWNYSDLNSAESGALVTGNFGQTYAASLELGQEIALNDGLSITPNAQLTYASTSFTGFTDSSGAVIGLDYANSLVGRVGIVIESNQASEQGDANLYALANVYYDMSGASQVDVSGTKLTTQPNGFSAEVGVGGSYIFGNGKYALNGEASVSSSFANATNDYQIKGSLGFKAKF